MSNIKLGGVAPHRLLQLVLLQFSIPVHGHHFCQFFFVVFACYCLQKKFPYALVDVQILVKSSVNRLYGHIKWQITLMWLEILPGCRRKVTCATVFYFFLCRSWSFSWHLWVGKVHLLLFFSLTTMHVFSLLEVKKLGGMAPPPGPSPCYSPDCTMLALF